MFQVFDVITEDTLGGFEIDKEDKTKNAQGCENNDADNDGCVDFHGLVFLDSPLLVLNILKTSDQRQGS